MENQTQQLDPQAVNLARAIRQQESGGDFTRKGTSGEYGGYQFVPKTWDAYAKEAGVNVGLEQATPEQQNEVAYKKIKSWKDSGYNVGQIASMWNAGEGKPDAYTQGHTGVNEYGAHYDTPAYAKAVADYYQQFKGQQPQQNEQAAAGNVETQKENLVAQGEPVSVRNDRAQPTFAGKLIRGLLKPTATLLARPIQVAKALGGADEEGQTIHSKYLGDIKTSTGAKDVVKDVGRGLETAALGVGGGEAANIATGIGKKTIGTLVKQGAKEGLKAGVLGGSGAAIEEGKSVGNVIKEGALGGALGGITGGALGGLVPAAGKMLGGAVKGAEKLGKLTGAIDVGAKDAENAINKIAQEYERAAGTGLKNSFRKQQLTRSGELRPWSQTLAEYGIVPQEGVNKTWDVGKALDDIEALNSEFGATKQNFIKNESALFNVDEAMKNAESRIDQTMKSEVARAKAKEQLRNEVEAVLGKSKVEAGANGERLINATDMEKLRDVGYELTPFNASDPQKIGQSAGYSLARAVNDTIDKYATFPSYRSFNREWSNILNAQNALEQLSTKTVRLSKGLSGQIALKVLAPVLGFSRGGIFGAILGDLGGEAAGRLLSDPELRTLVSRSILKKAQQKLPKDQIIKQLEAEIAAFVQKQAELPRLGPATTIPLGAKSPGESSVKLVPAQKGLVGTDPKTKKFMRTYTSEIKE